MFKTAVALTLALSVLVSGVGAWAMEYSPAPENDANFALLLGDMLTAVTNPSDASGEAISGDVDAISAVSERDGALARRIADHWTKVYLDPDYELFIYHDGDGAEALLGADIADNGRHAFVVMGYQLLDGEMQEELKARCEAAAAAARAYPDAIIVCSGGATGPNNPDGHTEAGLMKAYLTDVCGIDSSRIYIDENAMNTVDNAVNTFAILKDMDVASMTIITSSYHQKRGQALYNALSAIYELNCGYSAEIIGNFSCDYESSSGAGFELNVAIMQLSGILGLSDEAKNMIPGMQRGKPQ